MCTAHLYVVVARIEVDDRTEAYLRALQQKVTSDTQIVSSCWVQTVLQPEVDRGVLRDRRLGFELSKAGAYVGVCLAQNEKP